MGTPELRDIERDVMTEALDFIVPYTDKQVDETTLEMLTSIVNTVLDVRQRQLNVSIDTPVKLRQEKNGAHCS